MDNFELIYEVFKCVSLLWVRWFVSFRMFRIVILLRRGFQLKCARCRFTQSFYWDCTAHYIACMTNFSDKQASKSAYKASMQAGEQSISEEQQLYCACVYNIYIYVCTNGCASCAHTFLFNTMDACACASASSCTPADDGLLIIWMPNGVRRCMMFNNTANERLNFQIYFCSTENLHPHCFDCTAASVCFCVRLSWFLRVWKLWRNSPTRVLRLSSGIERKQQMRKCPNYCNCKQFTVAFYMI